LYLPLLSICLISLILGAYSYNAYLSSYSILYNFKIFISSIHVFKEKEAYWIRINFSIFNPSENELKLVYLKPEIYLNGKVVVLEEPSFIRFVGVNEVSLYAHKNTTISFYKSIKNEDFQEIYENAEKRYWFVNVYLTIRGVPLLELATLQRYKQFIEG
jgi:hypothetical protein